MKILRKIWPWSKIKELEESARIRQEFITSACGLGQNLTNLLVDENESLKRELSECGQENEKIRKNLMRAIDEKTIHQVMIDTENRKLKKENESLKRELEKEKNLEIIDCSLIGMIRRWEKERKEILFRDFDDEKI